MPVSSPNTLFAGTAGPNGDKPGPDKFIGRVVLYVLLAVVAPILVAIYVLWLWAFFFLRSPWWLPTPVFGVLAAAGGIRGWFTWPSVQAAFVQPWIDAVTSGEPARWAAEHAVEVLAGQFWLSAVAATGWAAVASGYKWWRRPQWKERHLKPGPYLSWRYRRTVRKLESANIKAGSGVTLGVAADTRDARFAAGRPAAAYGTEARQTDTEAASHTLVVGGSGTGKTTTLYAGMRDVIKMGRGLIVIDIKGGPDVPEQLATWAGRYGRPFYHWSFHKNTEPYLGPADQPAHWDPVSRGDPSRRKDLILGSQIWDVEFYKTEIANYLQTMFTVMDLVPPPPGVDNFTDIADLLNHQLLLRRAANLNSREHPELTAALSRIADIDPGALSGVKNMYSRFNTLNTSTGGPWLRPDPTGEATINLYDAATQGHVVVFSLDSNTYQGTAELVAGLVIQDLITVSSELRHAPAPNPVHVYVDEFGKAKSDNIKALLAQARDARMYITVATQNLSQMEAISPHLSEEICGTVGAFIVHRVNTEDEARYFAGLSGVRRKHLERTQVEQTSAMFRSLGAAANVGSAYLEEVDEANVLPGQFQELARGEFVYLTKARAEGGRPMYVCPVRSVKENPARVHAKLAPGVNARRGHTAVEESNGGGIHADVAASSAQLFPEQSKVGVASVAARPVQPDDADSRATGIPAEFPDSGRGLDAAPAMVDVGAAPVDVDAVLADAGAGTAGSGDAVLLPAADADIPDVNSGPTEPSPPAARKKQGVKTPAAQTVPGNSDADDVFWEQPADVQRAAPTRPAAAPTVQQAQPARPRRPGEPLLPPGVGVPQGKVPQPPKLSPRSARRGPREAGPYWDTPDMP